MSEKEKKAISDAFKAVLSNYLIIDPSNAKRGLKKFHLRFFFKVYIAYGALWGTGIKKGRGLEIQIPLQIPQPICVG